MEGFGQGESVVPMRVWLSQGRKKRKRPSDVDMSTMPMWEGVKYWGTTT